MLSMVKHPPLYSLGLMEFYFSCDTASRNLPIPIRTSQNSVHLLNMINVKSTHTLVRLCFQVQLFLVQQV